MNLLGTQISLKYKAFEIYLAGCRAPHCPGCHNPESWDFDIGTPITLTTRRRIVEEIVGAGDLIKNVWIMGGEPLHQPRDELRRLLKAVKLTHRKIWLFTRYDSVEDIPKEILDKLDYIKLGRYEQERASNTYTSYGVPLASTNQYIVGLCLWPLPINI